MRRAPSARRASRRLPGDDGHRAVAAGLEDLDTIHPGAAAAEADFGGRLPHAGLDGLEPQAPCARVAFELDLVEALQGREVAGQRRAYALREAPYHRVLLKRQAAALSAVLGFDHQSV